MYGRTGGTSEFGAGVALMGRYKDDLAKLQTNQFSLDQSAEAFEAAADKTKLSVKVSVLPNG
jgi:threonine dehydrogenase-like Zn-dependent dehydrogenase